MKQKVEHFRMSIRKQQNENEFSKKRSLRQQQADQVLTLEVPHSQILRILQGGTSSRDVDDVASYLAQENIAVDANPFLSGVQHMLSNIHIFSKLLLNLTFWMKQDQILWMLMLPEFQQVKRLLHSESNEEKDNYCTIIINSMYELTPEQNISFLKNFQTLEDICDACITYGANDQLYQKYFSIILYAVNKGMFPQNISQLGEVVDNLLQNTDNSDLIKISMKILQSLYRSYPDMLQLIDLLEKTSFLDFVFTDHTLYTLQFLKQLLEKSDIIFKMIIRDQRFFPYLHKRLQFFDNYKSLNALFELLEELFSLEIPEFEVQECELIEKLGAQIHSFMNHKQEIPIKYCNLCVALVASRHINTALIYVPIIKVVNDMIRQRDDFPIDKKDYLRMIKEIINIGETIYPDQYVGEFLSYFGEQILQILQTDKDEEVVELANEVLELLEDNTQQM